MNKKTVNIFTSCDGNYFKHIPTLIMSVFDNMPMYHNRFFLLHTDINQEKVNKVKKFSKKLGVEFCEIRMDPEKADKYRKLREMTVYHSNNDFSLEGMYICLPNKDLPEDVDRALYLDTGDIIIADNISEFYFSDFNGNIITASKGFGEDWLTTPEDLYNVDRFPYIAAEYFNSGSVLFNVDLMRRMNIDFDYYYDFLKKLRNYTIPYSSKYMPGRSFVVTDDQGLLATAFVGNTNFYDPQGLGHSVTPYNFRPFLFELNKNNNPDIPGLRINSLPIKIIHFIGNKPWTPADKRAELLPLTQDCLAVWDKYEQKAQRIMEGL